MEAAMAMIHSQPHLSLQSFSDLEDTMAMIHSQPHRLSLQSYSDLDDDDGDDGSSSSGELLRGDSGTASPGARSASSSLRRRSYGDVAIVLPAGGAAGGASLPRSSKPPPRHGNGRGGATDEHAADANLHVWTTDEHAAEAYLHVSAAPGYVSFEDVIGGAALYRDGSGRPLEAAISDPLLRTTSRLCARENGRSHPRRQPSPGPLGTRRGSPMHAIVKNEDKL